MEVAGNQSHQFKRHMLDMLGHEVLLGLQGEKHTKRALMHAYHPKQAVLGVTVFPGETVIGQQEFALGSSCREIPLRDVVFITTRVEKSRRFEIDAAYHDEIVESRDLEAWEPDPEIDLPQSSADGGRGWSVDDMFNANKRLGVKSSFAGIETYSTAVPVGDDEARREAERIAAEIERNQESLRFAHLENDDEERDLDKETDLRAFEDQPEKSEEQPKAEPEPTPWRKREPKENSVRNNHRAPPPVLPSREWRNMNKDDKNRLRRDRVKSPALNKNKKGLNKKVDDEKRTERKSPSVEHVTEERKEQTVQSVEDVVKNESPLKVDAVKVQEAEVSETKPVEVAAEKVTEAAEVVVSVESAPQPATAEVVEAAVQDKANHKSPPRVADKTDAHHKKSRDPAKTKDMSKPGFTFNVAASEFRPRIQNVPPPQLVPHTRTHIYHHNPPPPLISQADQFPHPSHRFVPQQAQHQPIMAYPHPVVQSSGPQIAAGYQMIPGQYPGAGPSFVLAAPTMYNPVQAQQQFLAAQSLQVVPGSFLPQNAVITAPYAMVNQTTPHQVGGVMVQPPQPLFPGQPVPVQAVPNPVFNPEPGPFYPPNNNPDPSHNNQVNQYALIQQHHLQAQLYQQMPPPNFGGRDSAH